MQTVLCYIIFLQKYLIFIGELYQTELELVKDFISEIFQKFSQFSCIDQPIHMVLWFSSEAQSGDESARCEHGVGLLDAEAGGTAHDHAHILRLGHAGRIPQDGRVRLAHIQIGIQSSLIRPKI